MDAINDITTRLIGNNAVTHNACVTYSVTVHDFVSVSASREPRKSMAMLLHEAVAK